MQPSEIRKTVLDDHETLRAILASLERVARQVIEGESPLIGAVRLEGEELLKTLGRHMHWEDLYLRPALLQADAWGQARAERLDDDHREQRELLAYSLSAVEDQSRPAAVIARQMLDLARLIREDMEDEERCLLDERVLRDDVVGIDVESG
jgi:hypothetical protein